MTENMLEIVDENDTVVGIAPRTEIHAKGLLHREINVLFITPDKDIIFQRRSRKDKSFGWLDATVGGHVEIGDDYLQAALRETFEETGLNLQPDKLILLGRIKGNEVIPEKKFINKSYKNVYGYVYHNDITNLQIEEGKAEGFELFHATTLFNLAEDIKAQFIPAFVDPSQLGIIYQKLFFLI